jgi:hypothetical protein
LVGTEDIAGGDVHALKTRRVGPAAVNDLPIRKIENDLYRIDTDNLEAIAGST